MEEISNKKPSNLFTVILSVIVVILIITNAFTLYFLFLKPNGETLNNTNNQKVNNNINVNENANINENLNSNIEPINTNQNIDNNQVENQISVDWLDPLVKVDKTAFFSGQESKSALDIKENIVIYKAGKITAGLYADSELYIVNFFPEGPVPKYTLERIVKAGDKLIILKGQSETNYSAYANYFSIDENTKISNIDSPQEIIIPDSKIKFIRSESEPYLMFDFYQNKEKLFLYNENDYIYKDNISNCFFIKASDSTAQTYYFDLGFVQLKEQKSVGGLSPYILNIHWNDGSNNADDYIFGKRAGCSGVNCYNYPEYEDSASASIYKKTGTTSTSDIIYEFKDLKGKVTYPISGGKVETKTVEDIYKTMYQWSGLDTNSPDNGKKISFSQFIADHPIIFWKDPFGDFIRIEKAKYQPMAECGKPVIYLYPEKEQVVSVKVKPNGGFSYTDPEYGNGWKVIAKPTGELSSPENFSTYPYLFWEGKAVDYYRPDKGFVVKKGEIKAFLEEKLAKLGLVKNEYDEFISFWLPKMQDYSYYFITFVPKEEFDRYAPLSVDPKPDTIIRVFMDFQGLSGPASVEEPEIITPQRKGFTVVEWGGALHK